MNLLINMCRILLDVHWKVFVLKEDILKTTQCVSAIKNASEWRTNKKHQVNVEGWVSERLCSCSLSSKQIHFLSWRRTSCIYSNWEAWVSKWSLFTVFPAFFVTWRMDLHQDTSGSVLCPPISACEKEHIQRIFPRLTDVCPGWLSVGNITAVNTPEDSWALQWHRLGPKCCWYMLKQTSMNLWCMSFRRRDATQKQQPRLGVVALNHDNGCDLHCFAEYTSSHCLRC